MSDLFGYEKKRGYRLYSLEVQNWGCFDGRYSRLEFNDKSSVFFGANSSGKSTMVDAIQTMLIPNTMRAYNSSADVKATPRRKESYVLGAKGNITDEETHAVIRNNLRKKEDVVTVLSICFREAVTDSWSTHMIFCFYNGDDLKENIFVFRKEMKLAELTTLLKGINLKSGSELRAAMKKLADCTYFDTYDRYQKDFQSRFGIDLTGLKLLKECIGSKDLGSLNITDFVRKYIIDDVSINNGAGQGREKRTIEETYTGLKETIESLSSIRKELTKAARQNDELKKVIEKGETRAELQRKEEKIIDCSNANENWYIDRSMTVLTDAVKEAEAEIEDYEQQIEENKAVQEEKSAELSNLKTDRIVEAIEKKRREKGFIESKLEDTKGRREKYSGYIEKINSAARRLLVNRDSAPVFRVPEDEASFRKMKDETVVRYVADGEKSIKNLERKKAEVDDAIRKDTEEKENLQNELDFLNSRDTNIPREYDEVRNGIASYLDLLPSELPFAGELMSIREEESEWERAIEDVLAPLSLTILVPHDYIEKAEKYLDEEKSRKFFDLDINLLDIEQVYALEKEDGDDRDFISGKIEYKRNRYSESLAGYVKSHYRYRCVEDIEEYTASQRYVVLMSGLHKNGTDEIKREKKDIRTKERFRYLGWNNERRKLEIAELMSSLDDEIKQCGIQSNEYGRKIELTREIMKNFNLIESFSRWEEIDTESLDERLIEIDDDIREIEELNKEKGDIFTRIRELEAEIRELNQKTSSLWDSKSESLANRRVASASLEKIEAMHRLDVPEETAAAFRNEYPETAECNTYDEIERCYGSLKQKLSAESAGTMLAIQAATNSFNQQIKQYLHPSIPEGELSWELEISGFLPERADVQDNGEVLEAYRVHYEKVKGCKVDSSEETFKKLFEEMVELISMLGRAIDSSKESVRRAISEVNEPLKNIVYDKNLKTHLQIITNENTDNDCRVFRSELISLLPDMGKLTQEYDYSRLLQEFNRIEGFFKRCEERSAFLKKVLDIRSYFTFYCREEFEDGREYKVHKDVDALSGGEKAQLTYTILGAALIYHLTYNNEDGAGPFRLLILDEAFSKLDPDKSEYAMKLFTDLGFQIIVVTPDPKFSLLKRYVRNFFYFNKNAEGRSNVVAVSVESVEGV